MPVRGFNPNVPIRLHRRLNDDSLQLVSEAFAHRQDRSVRAIETEEATFFATERRYVTFKDTEWTSPPPVPNAPLGSHSIGGIALGGGDGGPDVERRGSQATSGLQLEDTVTGEFLEVSGVNYLEDPLYIAIVVTVESTGRGPLAL